VLKIPRPDAQQLVGLHGFADTGETFQFVQAPLANRFELLFPDMRGHGDSSRLRESYYGAHSYFGDLIRFTGTVKKPYVLMGHSMGAAMAARFAGLYPDEISHLILLEGFSGISSEEEEIRRLRSFGDNLRKKRPEKVRILKTKREAELILGTVHEGLPPERISALAEYLAAPVEGGFVWKQDPEVKTGGIPIPFSPAFSRALWKRITCPVLFIYGERSHLLPGKRTNSSGSLDEILSHFQNLETHSLDSGHNPHHEKPEEVMQLLEAFFQKHPG